MSLRALFLFFFFLTIALFAVPNYSYAQEGTSKKKPKTSTAGKNRDGRRGDKASVNRRLLWKIRARNRRSRKAETPHRGDITGRPVRARRSPRPTRVNRAIPINPYAGKRKRTEATAAKQAARRYKPRAITASKSGERPHKGSISGGKLRTKNASSARSTAPKRRPISPYKYSDRKTEQDAARKAAKNKVRRIVSVSPKGESAGGGGRMSPTARSRSASGGALSNARARIARSRSKSQKPGSLRGKNVPMSISGTQKRVYNKPLDYGGRRRLSASQRARRASRNFGGAMSISGSSGPGRASKKRSPSVSGQFLSRRKRNPYRTHDRKKWEESHKGDITGRKLRNRNRTSPSRPDGGGMFNPYYGRKKTGERPYQGNVRSAAVSASRRSESSSKKGRFGQAQSVSGQFKGASPRSRFGPYYGKKRRSGDQPYLGNISPNRSSASRASENNPGKRNSFKAQSISGQFKGASPRSRFGPYYGKKRRSGDQPYLGNVSPNRSSASRASESNPGKRNSFKAQSISGQFKGGSPRSRFGPYYGRKRKSGDQAYAGKISPNRRSISRASENNPGQRGPARAQSISGQFKGGSAKPRFGPYYGQKRKSGDQAYKGNITPKNQSISRASESQSRRPKPRLAQSVTGQFKGNAKPSRYGPYYGMKRRSGDQAYDGKVNPQNMSASRSAESDNKKYKGRRKMSISGRSWNNDATPITVADRSKSAQSASVYSGTQKARKKDKGGGSISGQSWNNDATPILVKQQSQNIARATQFQGTIKRKNLPEQKDEYLDYKGSAKRSALVPELQDDYLNYSGTIKVQRKKGLGYHPSYYFEQAKTNSLKEKEKKFSIRLIWSKLFRSNQPSRDKPGKLEFDEREQGLWYE